MVAQSMSLPSGTKLGPSKIIGAIGAGFDAVLHEC